MSMVHTYAPLGEGSQDFWLERSNLIGAVLGGVAYGRQLTHLYLADAKESR